VLYRNGAGGREYLAISEHLARGSVEAQGLQCLLDSIVTSGNSPIWRFGALPEQDLTQSRPPMHAALGAILKI